MLKDFCMIRNVIKVTLFLALVTSASSVAQVAMALDLEYEGFETSETSFPFIWSPNAIIKNSQNLDINMRSNTILDLETNSPIQKKFSFQLYQGDNLDQIRAEDRYDRIIPDEDEDGYGISIKTRF